ncbi:CBS domain-containing protein [Flavobacterium algicola]|uniref:CBS domain-containing protein n=1 Tax=Flavobacterium algicola TaxID=556529 RepID=UPI001EFEAC9B|nr:CBS domain-containing protein [Flavobacterium algicola]MCG9791369.1 CBS domain-containing protein [Flavobacterium algicola]
MKQKVPVSSIMTENIVKLNLTDDLTKAEVLFKSNGIKHIPVVNNHKIVGILSLNDMLRVCCTELDEEADVDLSSVVYNMFTIQQVMTKNVVTIKPYTTIKEAAEILVKHDFHALPICEDDNLLGIVTSTDLIKYLLSQYDAVQL